MHNKLEISDIYQKYVSCKFTICTDTRNILPNSLFFALKGGNFDGNKYALNALKNGCKYAIVDDNSLEGENLIIVDNVLQTLQELAKYHAQALTIPIICIGGSNGKTTTKELMVSVLKEKYNTQYTRGNFNNHIGMPISLLSITPSHQIAVIELGTNSPGEIDFLCKIVNPKYGLITNIGKEHLEGFGDIEGVIKEESFLYFHLLKNNGIAFVNANDKVLMQMATRFENVFQYGTKGVDFDFEYKDNKTIDFLITHTNRTAKGKSALWGKYNAENIAAAIAVGIYFNIDLQKIANGIENYKPANNRSQIITTGSNTIFLDAYNANPSSMLAALGALKNQKNSNKVALLGDMGEVGKNDVQEHLEILNWLIVNEIKSVVCGALFYKASLQLKNPLISAFELASDCKNELQKYPIKNSIVLIKGSRTAAMEQFLVDL